ncbi:MAG: hypothetical protein F4X32_03965 [Candidatus Dadabacteria bacterium]|nr:hypothetical protein [Candidatus Dadabacteria bacterium]MYB26648.1 hypothetical protein [Candidatus Dadabacteria bacterium]
MEVLERGKQLELYQKERVGLFGVDIDNGLYIFSPEMSEEMKPSKIVRPVTSLDDVTRDWLKTKLQVNA